jgi:hypothetical protein
MAFILFRSNFYCLTSIRTVSSKARVCQGCDLLIAFRWYDAVCIDQTNIQERNQQVQEMSKIYAQASLVRIWLGYPNSWTKDLFNYKEGE